MNRKKGLIRITLKSDVCMGSGYSYAGIVDSDTCYDEIGIPFIPAKRLKGCLRESAETLLHRLYDDEKIKEVFGEKGSKDSSDFFIDNGYIAEYWQVKASIDRLIRKRICSTQEILGRFARVTGQTAMENGVADPQSLRYTRIVNHYSPFDPNKKEELVFYAGFSCSDKNLDMIKKCAMATRHIGLKRNRGLGNVKIEIVEIAEDTLQSDNLALLHCDDFGDGKTVISFVIENLQPLMMSKSAEDESINYIPGQQVLGYLAGRYLAEEGKNADDDEFKELFLKGETIISNLYPYDGENIYYPAPDYFNMLKKSKKIVSTLESNLPETGNIADKENYSHENGNRPKKLQGKFVALTADKKVLVHEVKKDVVYHHSHRNTHTTENGKEEGILYGMEVIRKGQEFAGTIITSSNKADLVKDLLAGGQLRFGKSKSAQYGTCRLVECKKSLMNKQSSFVKGKDIVVTFLSDTIISDETGTPTVFYDKVRELVAEQIRIKDKETDEYNSGIQTTTATGYMGTWNLRRAAVPAIKAGSFLTYNLEAPLEGSDFLIGERSLEGYGHVMISDAAAYKYEGKYEPESSEAMPGKLVVLNDVQKNKVAHLVLPVIYDRWLERRVNEAIDGNQKVDVSNSAAGRLLLMLRESVTEAKEEAKGNGKKSVAVIYRKAYENFEERIKSIKSEEARKAGEKLLERIDIDTVENNTLSSGRKSSGRLCRDDELDNSLITLFDDKTEMIRRWPDFVLAVLTDRKYNGR